jgi:RNA polymerase sigma-70 factor (ECF subfamily)
VSGVRGANGIAAGADPDQLLVSRAKLGDTNAFAALVRNHEPRALALALSLVRDEHDAREIVQEAFLRVFRGLDAFAGSSTFYTWLYRIVSNLAIDFLRKPARRETEHFDVTRGEDVDFYGLSSRVSDPFRELSNKQLNLTIARCMSALPPYHRGVIEMRELKGMSYEEMAHVMGVSKGTIMSRLFHARQKLQRSLRDCRLDLEPC